MINYRGFDSVHHQGRVMDKGEVTSLTQGFDLSNKPKGVYRIVVTNDRKTTTEILVIQ